MATKTYSLFGHNATRYFSKDGVARYQIQFGVEQFGAVRRAAIRGEGKFRGLAPGETFASNGTTVPEGTSWSRDYQRDGFVIVLLVDPKGDVWSLIPNAVGQGGVSYLEGVIR